LIGSAANCFLGDLEPLAVDAVDGYFASAELNAHGRLGVAVEFRAIGPVQTHLQKHGCAQKQIEVQFSEQKDEAKCTIIKRTRAPATCDLDQREEQ